MIDEKDLQIAHGGRSEYEMTKYVLGFFFGPFSLTDKISQHN